ncbi:MULTISPECIES: hypothetical protein [Dietzia]|uniref:hypothetical protein n=1 Tax=Dietzia TaxID=37914 RepID=UPI000AB251C9|nr:MULTISPECIES: hypothetical protein [Dietzia]MBB1020378.1 hypothetical protein [Dietzia sp. E1]MCT1638736.1 hypothetical protein [Dietzia cinnamea]MCT1711700.1 hypothetical protein [Dietzia cinnamea]MCT1884283.1 hypothetical protein [Dietzia cinnamea]
MGIDLGSIGGDNGLLAKDGIVDLGGTFLGAVNNLVKAVGYFVGGDFQKALDAGFMKA